MYQVFEQFILQYQGATRTELFAVAFLPLILGTSIYFIGTRTLESTTPLRLLRWLGFLPLFTGVYFGVRYMTLVSDPIYRYAFYVSDKNLTLHYLTLALPIVGIIGLLIWTKILKSSEDIF